MSLEPPEPKPTLRDIFLKALDLSADEREAYLQQACGSDAQLRAKVNALLKNQQDDSFLERPAVEGSPTMAISPAPLEGPGTVIGNYKLLEKLGEGGFGVVYMAEQKQPVKRRVALKIIKIGMDTREVVARFEAERQALAVMDHPNIAKIHDAGATATTLVTSEDSPLPSDGRGIKGEGHSALRTPHSALPPAAPTSSWNWSVALRSPNTATRGIFPRTNASIFSCWSWLRIPPSRSRVGNSPKVGCGVRLTKSHLASTEG